MILMMVMHMNVLYEPMRSVMTPAASLEMILHAMDTDNINAPTSAAKPMLVA